MKISLKKALAFLFAVMILQLTFTLPHIALAATEEEADNPVSQTYSEIEFALPANDIKAILKDKILYFTMGIAGLTAIDFTDPYNPKHDAYVSFPEKVSLIGINGSRLYLPVEDRLYITDINDLSQPAVMVSIPLGKEDFLKGIYTESNRMYLLYEKSIRVFSLDDPVKPALLTIFFPDNIENSTGMLDMAVRNNIVYALYETGIEIYNFSDLKNIVRQGLYTVSESYCNEVDFIGDYAYLNISEKNNTEVLNISDIKIPEPYGTISNIRGIVCTEGDMTFVINSKDGLSITDLVKHTVSYVKAQNIESGNTNPVSDPNQIPDTNKNQKIAYISIDDGPSRSITPVNLDTLKKYGIRATFFVLPRKDVDDIYKRIIDEGHVIGNHSYSHDYDYLYGSIENFSNDVIKARDFIFKRIGYTSEVYRFPGGSRGRNKDMIKKRAAVLEELGYSYFEWDVSTADTDPNLKKYGTEEEIVNLLANNVLYNAKDKKKLVILMHDSAGKMYSAKALPKIIDGLKRQGYIFDVLTNY